MALVAALGVLIGLGFTGCAASRTVKTERPVLGLHLPVSLTVSPLLSTLSRRVLISEAERIWQREQVELEWPLPSSVPLDTPLRALVIARPSVADVKRERWPVAELLPQSGDRGLAIASINGAQRVVAEAAPLGGPADVADEYRLGLVLGRALAHEIGHFLLATRTHATYGLMRANVDAREFAGGIGDSFSLDADASQWLERQLKSGAVAVTTLRTAGFSYRIN